MYTMIDVAKLANVSQSTVSRVLTGNVSVNPKTKERVLNAIQELNYKPNLTARSLKNGKTQTIGLIIPSIVLPVFNLAAKGIIDTARKNNYIILTCDTNEDGVIEKDYIDSLLLRGIDGIILATDHLEKEQLKKIIKYNVPYVFILKSTIDNHNYVCMDDYTSTYKLIKLLIEKGKRNIVLVNGSEKFHSLALRKKAYKDALLDSGIHKDTEIILDDQIEYQFNQNLIYTIEKTNPDAIFTTSEMRFQAIYETLNIMQRKDITIGTFRNYRHYLTNENTFEIYEDAGLIGKIATEKLISIIHGTSEPLFKGILI